MFSLRVIISDFRPEKELSVQLLLMLRAALKDYIAGSAAVSCLSAEAIYWTSSKTFGRDE